MMQHRRLRFSIASLLILTAIVALYLANNPYRPFHPRVISTLSTGDANGIAMIHTGIRRHKHDSALDAVEFVVIERLSVPGELKSRVTVKKSGRDYESSVVITLVDGAIELPAAENLMQLSDGEYTTLNAEVDVGTLSRFLSTFSSQSTIVELADLVGREEQAEP
ncbi:hypothetical protein CA13_09250 [Planctomycetes bacterium CA13]|uniref:Uncharacterized protein n=1 Tax=Novipirellula herctigrandis TaxID=2527986 RepID=A0A5C5YXZ6_9BACT|nr:hypothetical protein CA13_09250 [Planctomycetes bacterium CA13]